MVHQDGAAATSGTMWCWLVVPHVDGDGVVLHLHHSKHQPTSIVTPDNYSFCPCTRGRHKNAAMYVHKSFAFIKTAVVGAIFCGVYMAAHIYGSRMPIFPREGRVAELVRSKARRIYVLSKAFRFDMCARKNPIEFRKTKKNELYASKTQLNEEKQ